MSPGDVSHLGAARSVEGRLRWLEAPYAAYEMEPVNIVGWACRRGKGAYNAS
jgi:hypothetical protein